MRDILLGFRRVAAEVLGDKAEVCVAEVCSVWPGRPARTRTWCPAPGV